MKLYGLSFVVVASIGVIVPNAAKKRDALRNNVRGEPGGISLSARR